MGAPRRRLAAGLGGAAALAAGWIAAQRADQRALAADEKRDRLFEPFGGSRRSVAALDGTELAVRVFGPEDAPTIVMVHGWTCATEFWKLQVRALEGERRIVAYDLRGHGESARAADGDYTIETFGSDLGRVLEECVPDGERALLVGHSLGAMTIVDWAGSNPDAVDDRVSAAVLVNTGVGDLVSESLVVEGMSDPLGRLQRIAGEGVLRARGPIPSFTAPISSRLIRYAVLGPDASPAEVAFCERLVVSCPAAVRSAVGGTLTRLDLRAKLGALSAPTLVVAGECDRLTPPAHAHEMAAELPDVLDVIELPRSGHMSPIERPTDLSAMLAELAGCDAGVAQPVGV